MRLSVRLMALGVSGPLVGLGIFLAVSVATSIQLARTAKTELTELFNQDNRTNLLITTSLIQSNASDMTKQLVKNSEQLLQLLQPLEYLGDNQLTWKGRPLEQNQAPSTLNNILRLPLSLPQEAAGIYIEDDQHQWSRVSGITSEGNILRSGWRPTAAIEAEFTDLYVDNRNNRNSIITRNTMVFRDGAWRMTRLTALKSRHHQQRMVLMVNVKTEAANRILETSARLFPFKKHSLAFYAYAPNGRLLCTYAEPDKRACLDIMDAMKASGGIPPDQNDARTVLVERSIPSSKILHSDGSNQTLFLATFPAWNWLAGIKVEESLLNNAIQPMKGATINAMLVLFGATMALIGACGYAAWRIADSIKAELRKLADAANAIAAGESRTQLSYAGDDALARLVTAFNAMSSAVADREDSLKAQIQVLEINISEQALAGQVCSIVEDPSFGNLSERAEAMRQRRNRRAIP